MVEHEADEVHVVVASPPSLFDAAVLLRTLYTGLGPSGWRLHLIGMGRRPPAKLLAESRVPISVALGRVDEEAPPGGGRVYVVDPRGRPAWELGAPPITLLVDYGGALRRLYEAVPVSGLGLPSLTYEAAAVIYEFFIRRRVPPPPRGGEARSRDPRSGLYLARKLLEAIEVFDNYVVVRPSVLVYTLRRVYLARGVLLDPEGYRINVDPVSGAVTEVVEAAAYTKRYRRLGTVKAVFDGEKLRIEDWEGEAYVITVDAERGVACAAPGLCVGGGEEAAGDVADWMRGL